VVQVGVRAVDSGGLSVVGVVTIFVVDTNDAPIVAPASFSVPENSSVGRVVGTVTASDPDNLRVGMTPQALAFRISSGDNDKRFSINPTTGQITVAKASLDFEATSLFDLTVEVRSQFRHGFVPSVNPFDESCHTCVLIPR
jgi:hypothetical protein